MTTSVLRWTFEAETAFYVENCGNFECPHGTRVTLQQYVKVMMKSRKVAIKEESKTYSWFNYHVTCHISYGCTYLTSCWSYVCYLIHYCTTIRSLCKYLELAFVKRNEINAAMKQVLASRS